MVPDALLWTKKPHSDFAQVELSPPPERQRILLDQISSMPNRWMGIYVEVHFPMAFEAMKALYDGLAEGGVG